MTPRNKNIHPPFVRVWVVEDARKRNLDRDVILRDLSSKKPASEVLKDIRYPGKNGNKSL